MKYRCPNCDHVYDEATGDPHEGFPAGTPWSQVPDDWSCPGCAVRDKVDFEQVTQGNSTAPMRAATVPDRPST